MKSLFRMISLVLSFNLTLLACSKDDENYSKAEVTTSDVTVIMATSAACGGAIINDGGLEITEKGVIWHTSANVSIENFTNKTIEKQDGKAYTSQLYDLKPNTSYYIKAYAVNELGISYGEEKQFTTAEATLYTKADITTKDITTILATSATCNANLTNDGGKAILQKGVVWHTQTNPSLNICTGKTEEHNAEGEFSSLMSDLKYNTTYYVRAYAVNELGTSYGEEIEFKTLDPLKLKMVQVAGGTFQMGSDIMYGTSSKADHKPIHTVTLNSFEIGKYEVTQGQWEIVMGKKPVIYDGENFPVRTISWNDAIDFITKLNTLTGLNYRLPTEAEWEFAARGGNSSKGYRYSGSNNADEVAWYYSDIQAVGLKKANELGIHDMSGNVAEWCNDYYHHLYYKDSPSDNPQGPKTGSTRVFRGGAWHFVSQGCGVEYRNNAAPCESNSYDRGVRLVRSMK